MHTVILDVQYSSPVSLDQGTMTVYPARVDSYIDTLREYQKENKTPSSR